MGGEERKRYGGEVIEGEEKGKGEERKCRLHHLLLSNLTTVTIVILS